ncbi:hypothetical protein NHP20013_09420 [Helicobacter bizzozeronii]|nr:hypothetical protein NHP20013_09420 [Helicobacter bizzozeronii]
MTFLPYLFIIILVKLTKGAKLFIFKPDESKIISEFGNKRAFAKHYGVSYSSVHFYLFGGKTPTRMSPLVLGKFKKMEVDGYITMEYDNGN